MLRKRSFFVLAAMMAVSACASGGGGGGVTPPVVPPVIPPVTPPVTPPTPYASNCTATPGAISCTTTGQFQLLGPQAGLRADGTVTTGTFDFFSIQRKGSATLFDEDTYVLANFALASLFYHYYKGFQSKDDGLGPVRVAPEYRHDGFGNLLPVASGSMTLFDITNVLQGGLDYVQLGKISPNPVNGAYGFFAVGRYPGTPSMPTTGSARYDGGTRGLYVNGSNVAFSTASDVTMTANFATGAVSGSTSNFKMVDAAGVAAAAPAGLAFTFNGNIAGAAFTGTASNSGMTGSVNGAFYGELGGAPVEAGLSYNLGSSTGGGSMMGVGGLKKN
jgi:hypothetical protein